MSCLWIQGLGRGGSWPRCCACHRESFPLDCSLVYQQRLTDALAHERETTSYEIGAAWLAECARTEDWGCGAGGLSTLIPPARYPGIDGTPSARTGALSLGSSCATSSSITTRGRRPSTTRSHRSRSGWPSSCSPPSRRRPRPSPSAPPPMGASVLRPGGPQGRAVCVAGGQRRVRLGRGRGAGPSARTYGPSRPRLPHATCC